MRIESSSCLVAGIKMEILIKLFGKQQNLADLAGISLYTSHFEAILLTSIAFAPTVPWKWITTYKSESNLWPWHWHRRWKGLSPRAWTWDTLGEKLGTQYNHLGRTRMKVEWRDSLWNYLFLAFSTFRGNPPSPDSLNHHQSWFRAQAIFIFYNNRSLVYLNRPWNKRRQSIVWSDPYHRMKNTFTLCKQTHRIVLGAFGKLVIYHFFPWAKDSTGNRKKASARSTRASVSVRVRFSIKKKRFGPKMDLFLSLVSRWHPRRQAFFGVQNLALMTRHRSS